MNKETAFECQFEVRWADLDGNRHVRNTIFSEYATHTRFRLLEKLGFSQGRLEEMQLGPVVWKEEIRYRREALFGDILCVNASCSGLSPDGSQWRVRQDVLRGDGKEAAILTIQGGWIDLKRRKAVAPPPELAEVMLGLPRTSDYEDLSSLVRRRNTA